MKHKLPDTIISPEDLSALILELREYKAWQAQYAIKKRAGASKLPDAPELTPPASAYLADLPSPLTESALETSIHELERLHAAPSKLVITLAAVPNDAIKRQIVTWCRSELTPDALVSFQFNSTILGGLVVRCGSRIFDWSFRRQILDKKNSFAEVLHRV